MRPQVLEASAEILVRPEISVFDGLLIGPERD